MFKTGLRVSDTLELTHDCLVKLNNKYWITTDIEKVYVEGHRIPIDDELDDTKRKVFDNAVKQGIFSFDESDKLKEENNGEIPSDVIEMLYTNHKLNAIDTPYGTCMQRTNGKCSYAK